MNDWFRSWHGAPTDNKWLVIAKRAGCIPAVVSAVVWALLDHASQAEDRGSVEGFDVETYAAFSGLHEDEIRAVIKALDDKGILTDEMRFAAWDKRQPKREDDTAAERKRRQRDRDKESPEKRDNMNGHDLSRDVTHGHAASQNVTTDTDTEKNRIDSVPNGTAPVKLGLNESDDPKAILFGRGLETLQSLARKPADRCRSLLGSWLKKTHDEPMAVLRIIDDAAAMQPAEPVAWIEAALRTRLAACSPDDEIEYDGDFEMLCADYPLPPGSSKLEAYRAWLKLSQKRRDMVFDGALALADIVRNRDPPPLVPSLHKFIVERRYETLIEMPA